MMGDGAITSLNRKEGMNTRSSTEVVAAQLMMAAVLP